MSQTQYTCYLEINGAAATELDVYLSDSTGSYGVKNNDDDSVVVADAQAMTEVGGGWYSWTFTDPGYDLEYTAYVEYAYAGVTIRFSEVIDGTPTPSSVSYGSTLSQLESMIAARVKLDTTVAAELSLIDEAITAAGMAACTWEGRKWWWLRGRSSFDTVADTASYNLHTVNTNAMTSLWSVERVYMDDDWKLTPIPIEQYDDLITLQSATGKPLRYMIDGNPPTMYLWETPDDEYTIYIKYIKRHSNITSAASADTDLLVPDQFHQPVYVDGAIWLLRNGVGDPGGLRNAPFWVDAMQRMAEAAPSRHEDLSRINKHADVQPGTWPHDKHVFHDDESTIILDYT